MGMLEVARTVAELHSTYKDGLNYHEEGTAAHVAFTTAARILKEALDTIYDDICEQEGEVRKLREML